MWDTRLSKMHEDMNRAYIQRAREIWAHSTMVQMETIEKNEKLPKEELKKQVDRHIKEIAKDDDFDIPFSVKTPPMDPE